MAMNNLAGALLMIFLFASSAHAFREENISIPDGNVPIAAHLWMPDNIVHSAEKLPLIVLSHGAGGGSEDFEDTAQALADAGFVVAAVMHPGNNYRDNSYVRLGNNLSSRPGHVSRTIDHMLTAWHAHQSIDAARIGVFGFSAGGFTALVLAGGRANLELTAEHCRVKPEAWDCNYLRKHGAQTKRTPVPADAADARVKASVIAAPAVGYSFEPNGLADVRIPIQLWNAQNDTVIEDSAEIVRRLLPPSFEYHLVPKANHFVFMRPCDWKLRSIITVMHWFGTNDICADPEGFDRASFRDEFNRAVVRFFSDTLQVVHFRNP